MSQSMAESIIKSDEGDSNHPGHWSIRTEMAPRRQQKVELNRNCQCLERFLAYYSTVTTSKSTQ